MKILDKIISCSYADGAFTSANLTTIRNSNDSNGYLGVSITDNTNAGPVPSVALAADGAELYGAVIAVNETTQRASIATTGIIPFKLNAATGATNITDVQGVLGAGAGVTKPGTAGKGLGRIVSRSGTDQVVWVDLDRAPIAP